MELGIFYAARLDQRHAMPISSMYFNLEKWEIARTVLLDTLVCFVRNAKTRTHRRSRAVLIVPAAAVTC